MLKINELKLDILNYLFLVLVFFLLNSNQLKADVEQDFSSINYSCDGDFHILPEKISNFEYLPKKININFVKSQKWYQNYFKLAQYLGPKKYKHTKQIPQKYKKYFLVRILVEYEGGIQCTYNGKARIHGGRGDHVSDDKFINSLNIQIFNGSINGISEFILFLPVTRKNNEEIFTTLLLEKAGILSPFTMNTEVKINDSNYNTFLFQEKINQNFLNRKKKSNNILMSLNKKYQIKSAVKDFDPRYDRLARLVDVGNLKNSDYINAIDNMNYFLDQNYILNYNFKNLNQIFNGEEKFENIYASFKNKKRINVEKFSIFQALMISVGSKHVLDIDDLKYSFNNFYNILEPIYYDGMSNILDLYSLSSDQAFKNRIPEYVYQGALKLSIIMEDIDVAKFQQELDLRNSNINITNIKSSIDQIKKNLLVLTSSEIYLHDKINLDEVKYNYFGTIDNPDNIKLAFGGHNKILKYCNIELSQCKDFKILDKDIKNLLRKHVVNIKGENLFYVRRTIDSYKKRSIPLSHGLELFNSIKLNKNVKIYYKSNNTNIEIDYKKKIIDIYSYSKNERIIFISKKLDNWSINYLNKKIGGKYIKSSLVKGDFPSGCINFIDSSFQKLKIDIKNSDCPDAINFYRSTGSILKLKISDSAFDALDSDFSNLKIEEVIVNNAKQECIGVKSGNYEFKNIYANNCSDKALSAGERSTVNVNTIKVENSNKGIFSKEASAIYVGNYFLFNVKSCIGSVKNKPNFSGSYVNISKIYNKCSRENYIIDNTSKIIVGKNEF